MLHAIEAIPPDVDVDVDVAVRAGSLDPEAFAGDPADRLIYATAVEQDAGLATADARMRAFDPARIVW